MDRRKTKDNDWALLRSCTHCLGPGALPTGAAAAQGKVAAWGLCMDGLKGIVCNRNLVVMSHPRFTLIKFPKLEKEVNETGPRNSTNWSLNCRAWGDTRQIKAHTGRGLGREEKKIGEKERELVEISRTFKHESWVQLHCIFRPSPTTPLCLSSPCPLPWLFHGGWWPGNTLWQDNLVP